MVARSMIIAHARQLFRFNPRPRAVLCALSLFCILIGAQYQAQAQSGNADSAYPSVCALSGQVPEQGGFDPAQVEFVSKPQPFSFDGKSMPPFQLIARVLGLRPLVFEVLDQNDDEVTKAKGPCERVRIYAVDERLGKVLPRLRFGELVKVTEIITQGNHNPVLTALEKIEGAPVYFQEAARTGLCSNRSGTLVQYRTRFGATVVVNRDGSIYFHDEVWRVFNRRRADPEDLVNLMKTLQQAGFNSFTSQKWEVGDHSVGTYIALACSRFQKVLIADHDAEALAPAVQILEKIKAKALSNTYYSLTYDEKREIQFLDWPLPQVALDQVENIKHKAQWEEPRPNTPKPATQEDLKLARLPLPPEFYAKLPIPYPGLKPEDPNRDVYVRDGSRIYRVAKNPANSYGSDAGTVFGIQVQEVVSAEAALAALPAVPRNEPWSRLVNAFGGYIWPEGMGVRLGQILDNHQAITNEEYSRHQPLYSDLLYTEIGGPGGGVNFIEGRFRYTNVRLTQLERESR